jgi:hypothetical protein
VLWPLTGIESGAVPPHPALAVKVENSVDARPQTGLGAADMVWEEVVEGGITRFVAVYHSTLPPEIGPVRSVRPMASTGSVAGGRRTTSTATRPPSSPRPTPRTRHRRRRSSTSPPPASRRPR